MSRGRLGRISYNMVPVENGASESERPRGGGSERGLLSIAAHVLNVVERVQLLQHDLS